MKIAKVSVNNFLCLSEVEISPDSKLNLLVGKNRQGKTSFIKAIETGILGTTDPSVIKHGADKAEIMIDLDEVTVQRTITPSGQRVSVKNKEGWDRKSPQKFLDTLLGDLSFNPIAFMLLKASDKAKELRELCKTKAKKEDLAFLPDQDLLARVNWEGDGLYVLKSFEDHYYKERTLVNKEVVRKKALYESTVPEGYDPETPYDEAVLMGVKKEEEDATAAYNQAKGTIEAAEKNKPLREKSKARAAEYREILSMVNGAEIEMIPTYEAQIDELTEQIKALEAKRDSLHSRKLSATQLQGVKDDTTRLLAEEEERLQMLQDTDLPDLGTHETRLMEIRAKVTDEEEKAEQHEKYLSALEMKADWEAEDKKSKDLTEIIDKLRNELPAKLVKDAKIPIKGLRFEGDAVYIGDTALDNMSTSEQVKVALDIVRAMNKAAKLKLLCLDRAESLDDETLEEFRNQIKEDEFQYFLTVVQHGDYVPEGSYVVENGEVKGS
jgi:DNA repair exonuclease SbcCD ATPase subunit